MKTATIIIWWVLANIVGLSLSLFMILVVDESNTTCLFIISLLLAGFVLGKIQSVVLSRHLSTTGWTWASAFGWAAGLIINGIVVSDAEGFAGQTISWLILGTVLGAAQAIAINTQPVPNFRTWWILASGVSFVLAGTIGSLLSAITAILFGELAAYITILMVVGILYGVGTALPLSWNIRNKQKIQSIPQPPVLNQSHQEKRYIPQFKRHGSDVWEDYIAEPVTYREAVRLLQEITPYRNTYQAWRISELMD